MLWMGCEIAIIITTSATDRIRSYVAILSVDVSQSFLSAPKINSMNNFTISTTFTYLHLSPPLHSRKPLLSHQKRLIMPGCARWVACRVIGPTITQRPKRQGSRSPSLSGTMANVLAPPWPTSTASGVFSQHGFSQSSGGNPIGGDLKKEVAEEEEEEEEEGEFGDGNSIREDKVAAANEHNTQESFTQQTMLSMTQMTNNELTQLGGDDDDMCDEFDDNDESLSQDCCHSPILPIDPLTLPWGRLMPVAADGGGQYDDGGRNGGNLDNQINDRDEHLPFRLSSSSQQQQQRRGSTEMLPRSPANSRGGGGAGPGVATRSRSPSLGGATIAESLSSSNSHHSPASQVNFLGLKNLMPGDRFNEYVIGRSVKVRIIFEAGPEEENGRRRMNE